MPILSAIGQACARAFGMFGGTTVTATYLVVAGGGGGGNGVLNVSNAGGGGGGGYQTSTISLNPTLSYTVTVGAGGATNTNGGNSTFSTITSTGGGAGGYNNAAGSSGGSGGGGAGTSAGTYAGGSGTSGQGYAGGSGYGGGGNYGSGGGGGASAVGSNGTSSVGGNGGAGTASSISGSSVTYAGGGGGGAGGGTASSGGAGGGGNGSNGSADATPAGTANLGGGGGGGSGANGRAGSAGGSGVVIISYPAPQKFGGGIVTTSGSNVIHTFQTSGTLSPLSTISASYLIVAGGGGGGYANGSGGAGGGGAGGLLSGSSLTLDSNSNYLVTVGAGGATGASSGTSGVQGSSSAFSMVTTTAVGGGYGAVATTSPSANAGGNGGSGGGAAHWDNATASGGTATSGQGYAGGSSTSSSGERSGAGGGGAGSVGGNSNAGVGGNGGTGVASSISGTSTYYAGGGGGNYNSGGGGSATTGGSGVGGAGGNVTGTTAGVAGTVNTGSGGGGGGGIGGAGGSGIVIISYAGSTQLMAGGTVTITGGNVIHTFTTSGYLTPIKYVNNSLRFRSSASAYLSRTPTVASNQKTWTWSAWVKRGSLGTQQSLFATSSQNFSIFFGSGNDLRVWTNGGNGSIYTNAVYRDPAAWYHIVLQSSTVSPYFQLYVNGSQVTSFSYDNRTTYPGASNTEVDSAVAHYISGYTGYYFDGYMSEINFIDGQALAPTAFGTFNSYGVWQPITYGGSYGTNGFYLPFTNTTSTTTLGYDFSPNGNNWTTNNISLTAGSTYDSMTDVPTLTSATAANYCVLNPIDSFGSPTISNGNLYQTGGTWGISRGTIAPSSGKWYFEALLNEITYSQLGVAQTNIVLSSDIGNAAGGWDYYPKYNEVKNNSVSGTAGGTGANNDIVMVAYDLDNGKLWFGLNGTWFNSGNPATGANANYSNLSGSIAPAVGTYSSGAISVNFGQRPFTYTPPSGYVALNTYNL